MTKKTHVASSCLLTTVLVVYTPLSIIPSAIGGFIGAVLPDYDFFVGKHRGFSHSIICALIVGIIGCLFNVNFGVALGFSYLLHIVLDSFTKMGVPILKPFNDNYYGFKLIKSGGSEDLFICIVIIFILTEWIVKI